MSERMKQLNRYREIYN